MGVRVHCSSAARQGASEGGIEVGMEVAGCGFTRLFVGSKGKSGVRLSSAQGMARDFTSLSSSGDFLVRR